MFTILKWNPCSELLADRCLTCWGLRSTKSHIPLFSLTKTFHILLFHCSSSPKARPPILTKAHFLSCSKTKVERIPLS